MKEEGVLFFVVGATVKQFAHCSMREVRDVINNNTSIILPICCAPPPTVIIKVLYSIAMIPQACVALRRWLGSQRPVTVL